MEKRKLTRPLNRSEGFHHIENYYRSGLRASEYYKQAGITQWQFYSWRRRYLLEHPESAPIAKSAATFHRLNIEDSPGQRISGLEIHYPHGVKLMIGSGHPLEIASLISLIQIQV
jgi:hypothetical protein